MFHTPAHKQSAAQVQFHAATASMGNEPPKTFVSPREAAIQVTHAIAVQFDRWAQADAASQRARRNSPAQRHAEEGRRIERTRDQSRRAERAFKYGN